MFRSINGVKTALQRGKSWSVKRQLYQNTRLLSESKSVEKSDKDVIQLSDSCVKRLQKIQKDDSFLRVMVDGGGCSGFQYKFELGTQLSQEDKIFERDGAKVVIDTESLEFVKGSTIDYHEELIRAAFQVIDNPLAEQGCSCGASFALKF